MFRSKISSFKIVLIISILGLIITIMLCGIYFRFSYFEPDTVSYLFQAKLFAHGKLCEKAPPEFGFSSSPHINILNGKWYSKYPFGNALMLTLGVFVNAPWLIPAIVTSLSFLFLYLLVNGIYDRKIALLATAFGLISPATLVMGATWFSEPVSRFFLAIFLFALIKTLRSAGCLNGSLFTPNSTRQPALRSKQLPWQFYPAISGFALGYVLNTRPLTAFAFGLCSGGFVLYWIARCDEKKRIIKAMSIFLIPFFAMVFVCMAWNYYFTGNPLKFTHNAAQPHDKIGFGKRTEGYDADLENAFVFTPGYSLQRLWRHVLPCISLNTLGWGYYQPNLFRSKHNYTDSIVAGLLVKSPTEEDWVTLKLWGHGDGTAQLQFQARGREAGNGLTGRVPGFLASGGRSEIEIRIAKNGDEYTGYFRTAEDNEWLKVRTTTLKLTPPLEVGIYAGNCTLSGNMTVDFDRLYFESDVDVTKEDFDGIKLSSKWLWIKEPKVWDVGETKQGWLHIKADRNSDFWVRDDIAKLYRMTDSDRFDTQTRFIANWKDDSDPLLILRIIPLIFPFILMLIPIFHTSRNRYDFLFLSFFLTTGLLYFFFYFDGSTFGFTAINARYYTECTLLAMIPLIAKGIFIIYSWIGSIMRKNLRITVKTMFCLIFVILTINTVHTYILQATPLQNWGAVYQKLPRLVKKNDIHKAVVFIPYHRGAPFGEYPFKSLEEADVVYFKLGPSKMWKLTNNDWKAVWNKYFKERRPYIYEGGKLSPLKPPIQFN